MAASSQKLRIIVGGLVGQYPLGGVAWDYFHYVLGLAEMGHDVYYHEDTNTWPIDPATRFPTDDPSRTGTFIEGFFKTYAPALAEKWHYLLLQEKSFGMTAEAFAEVARTADVFLNVSGTCFIPHDLNPRCLKVFLDTDPGYNQIMLHERPEWAEKVDEWCAMVDAHDRHLTYAENIYADDCVVPRMDFDWIPTRCIATLPQWESVRATPPPAAAPFTTVMSWDYFKGPIVYAGKGYFNKVPEYDRFQSLPQRVSAPMALAINSYKFVPDEVSGQGWQLLDATVKTATPESYRQFIADSFGEWSIAKQIYVATRTGWFSCRTACYLAGGRPAVVQDTAWSRYVPSGDGLFAFWTMDEAIDAVNRVAADPHRHRRAAYDVAREYLAPDRVLTPMLEAIFATGGTGRTAPRPPGVPTGASQQQQQQEPSR